MCDDFSFLGSYRLLPRKSVFQVTIFVGYAAAGLSMLSAARRIEGTEAGRMIVALGLICLTLAAHAVSLWQAINPTDGTRISLGTTASLIGAVIAIAALFSSRRVSLRGVTAIMLVMAGLLALAGNLGNEGASAAGSYDRWYLYAHVVLSVVAYAMLSVAAVLAVLMTVKDRLIRSGTPGTFPSLMPPLETMDTALFGAIGVGVAALTLSIFSGMIFVDNLFAQHLVHKTTLTLLSLVVFGTLLAGRWRFGWRGRKAVKLTLWGFVTLLLAYFGSRVILEVVLERQWG